MIDVLIIGCGIVGAAAAYELSRYDLKVSVVDRLNDIAGETTRANSGLIHSGFDPTPGTQMAKLNVRGSQLTRELCAKLDIPYKQNGALVIGFNNDDKAIIEKLYESGVKNKVPGIEIISGEKARELEPRLSKEVTCALSSPGAAIISPWDFAVALAETAALNGVEFNLGTEVTGIKKTASGYCVTTSKGEFEAKAVVNAAGLYADKIHGFLKKPDFKILPSRGQYYLLDKTAGNAVTRTIFQCPNKFGKGILVTPTVHGNLLVGPSSESVNCPGDTATDAESLDNVWKTAAKSVPGLNIRDNIRNFAGVRAVADTDDFIIREADAGFYDLAGIKSPGLSAAPAIAEELISLIKSNPAIELSAKKEFIDTRSVTRFRYLNSSQRAQLISKTPAYGRIVCRCENITEGEILEAFNSPIPPTTVDGIKRRCHAGMGRCQGGFCSPRIIELISKRFGIAPTDVLKDRAGSYIITGIKGVQA
ncbi:MAG: NAD(P)/FAD-dependent oxidoreductase [Defluviitaleaceae bacterium]|nr:NAD(P)/FAD-dependent oxidoreductase [Defluviitaleaceae bacterium]